MRGCVWLGSTYIDAVMTHRVPAGFALVPVTPGTDIVRGKPRVVEAEGSKRAPRKQPAAAEVRRVAASNRGGLGRAVVFATRNPKTAGSQRAPRADARSRRACPAAARR
jgi:hypothetical protein